MATIVREGVLLVELPDGDPRPLPRVTARGFDIKLDEGESLTAFLSRLAQIRLQMAARLPRPLVIEETPETPVEQP